MSRLGLEKSKESKFVKKKHSKELSNTFVIFSCVKSLKVCYSYEVTSTTRKSLSFLYLRASSLDFSPSDLEVGRGGGGYLRTRPVRRTQRSSSGLSGLSRQPDIFKQTLCANFVSVVDVIFTVLVLRLF